MEIFTLGVAAADQVAQECARYESDYVALGALMLLYLAPVHPMIGLDGTALVRFGVSVADDCGIPSEIRDLLVSVLNRNPSRRPDPRDVLNTLSKECLNRRFEIDDTSNREERKTRQLLESLTDSIISAARYERRDRLCPADPKVFVTSPIRLAYGACGVVYALKRICGDGPDDILKWIENENVTNTDYPPGLYIGTAGIAWALWELGREERAQEVLLDSYSNLCCVTALMSSTDSRVEVWRGVGCVRRLIEGSTWNARERPANGYRNVRWRLAGASNGNRRATSTWGVDTALVA